MDISFKAKAYKKGKGLAINLTGGVANGIGITEPCEIVLTKTDNGVITMRPASPGVLVTISGKPCYTWEEAAWAVEAERAKEQEALYAEDAPDRQGDQNGDDPENE